MMSRRVDLVEVVDRQNAIIRIQSKVINELFKVVMQYTDEDWDSSNINKMVNEAAEIRSGINT